MWSMPLAEESLNKSSNSSSEESFKQEIQHDCRAGGGQCWTLDFGNVTQSS